MTVSTDYPTGHREREPWFHRLAAGRAPSRYAHPESSPSEIGYAIQNKDLIDPTRVGLVRRQGVSRTPRWLSRLLGPLIVLAAWQVLSTSGVFNPQTTPAPALVVSTAYDMIASGELLTHLSASLLRVAMGLAVGLILGVAGAVLAGLSRVGENLVDANMEILRAVPNFALLPVLIAWFGIGEEPKVLLITLGVWVAIYINTYSAIRNVDASLVEAARTFGVRRWEMIRSIILPGALPGFLVGLRIALTAAWLALIFAETVNAPTGLGRLMNDAREYFRLDIIFVLLAVYAGLGLASLTLVRFLEARLLTWRRAFDGA